MSYSASEYDRDSVGLSLTHGLGCVVFGETWLAEEGILVPENWGFFQVDKSIALMQLWLMEGIQIAV